MAKLGGSAPVSQLQKGARAPQRHGRHGSPPYRPIHLLRDQPWRGGTNVKASAKITDGLIQHRRVSAKGVGRPSGKTKLRQHNRPLSTTVVPTGFTRHPGPQVAKHLDDPRRYYRSAKVTRHYPYRKTTRTGATFRRRTNISGRDVDVGRPGPGPGMFNRHAPQYVELSFRGSDRERSPIAANPGIVNGH